MPLRNAAATLRMAVDGILAQSFGDFEFILFDHGSTDATPEMIRQYAETDPRIKTASCHGSFIDAINMSWQMANGDLIARMDSDDFAYPDRIAKQREFLIIHPELVGCASRVRILKKNTATGIISLPDSGYATYDKWINSIISARQIARERFIDNPLPNPSTMMRREILEEMGGYRNAIWAEDYDLLTSPAPSRLFSGEN